MDGKRRSFVGLLVNTLIANVTTSFLWFALIFWIYLETRSVLANSLLGGVYMLLVAVMAVPFGSWVDRWRKKQVMVVATTVTAVAFAASLVFFLVVPTAQILTVGSAAFWVFSTLVLTGAVVESARGITLSTCVTLLVEEPERAKANGQVGMVKRIGIRNHLGLFGSGGGPFGHADHLVDRSGADGDLAIAPGHGHHPRTGDPAPRWSAQAGRLRRGVSAVIAVPGLTALILFATFNNLLGGSFMALMDPYGLTLVSVEVGCAVGSA